MDSQNQKSGTTGKSVTLSVRISQDDALFLSQYKVEGKITPSDKLRALIRESREQQQGLRDFRHSIDMFEKMLAPINSAIRETEMTEHVHSELVSRIMSWLPDMMALVVSASRQQEESHDRESLLALEEEMVERVFRLVETVLQLGITEANSCYRSDAISSRVGPAFDLFEIIKNRKQ
jgi:hypothetical protein